MLPSAQLSLSLAIEQATVTPNGFFLKQIPNEGYENLLMVSQLMQQ